MAHKISNFLASDWLFGILHTPLYSFTGSLKSTQLKWVSKTAQLLNSRAAVVHFNFRAGSTFSVRVCTVPHGHWVNKADNQQDLSLTVVFQFHSFLGPTESKDDFHYNFIGCDCLPLSLRWNRVNVSPFPQLV